MPSWRWRARIEPRSGSRLRIPVRRRVRCANVSGQPAPGVAAPRLLDEGLAVARRLCQLILASEFVELLADGGPSRLVAPARQERLILAADRGEVPPFERPGHDGRMMRLDPAELTL